MFTNIEKFTDENIDLMMQSHRYMTKTVPFVSKKARDEYDALLAEKNRRLNVAPGAEAAREALHLDRINSKPVTITPKMFEHMWNLYR